MPSTTIPSALRGIPAATLQVWLIQAQGALNQLLTGGQPQIVAYGQGDGTKSVTYTRSSLPALRAYIGELQAALGIGCGRRAIGVQFR